MFKYDTALHTLEKRCLYLIVVHWNRNSKVVGKDGRRVLKEKCMFKIHFINSISFLKRGIFSPLKKKKKGSKWALCSTSECLVWQGKKCLGGGREGRHTWHTWWQYTNTHTQSYTLIGVMTINKLRPLETVCKSKWRLGLGLKCKKEDKGLKRVKCKKRR